MNFSDTGCKIHVDKGLKVWSINKDKIQDLYPLLYKDIEIGGKFLINNNNQINTELDTYKTTKGESDSVQAPDAIVNFHTHPISCYKGEDTVFGWFSGEDVRETVLFSMKGSVAHLVISVEGVYILQVNPCILNNFMVMDNIQYQLDNILKSKKARKKMKWLVSKVGNSGMLKDYKEYVSTGNAKPQLLEFIKDIFRGIIIVSIEVYFRSTHRFRSYDINSNNYLYPSDYIKFVNSFKLSNIFNHNKSVNGCGNLGCNGIPVYEKKQTQKQFNKYLLHYEKSTQLYLVNNKGNVSITKVKLYKCSDLFPYIEDLIENSKQECKQLHYPANSIFKWNDNWFHMSLYRNEVEFNGRYIDYTSNKLTGRDRKEILNSNNPQLYLAETPKFYYFDISGNCDHSHTSRVLQKTHKIHTSGGSGGNIKITEIVVMGSLKCPWTVKLDSLLKEYNIPFTPKYLPDIRQSIQSIQKYNPEINSIPALFVVRLDGDIEYIGGYDSAENFINNLIIR